MVIADGYALSAKIFVVVIYTRHGECKLRWKTGTVCFTNNANRKPPDSTKTTEGKGAAADRRQER